jgi:hypothetical protein
LEVDLREADAQELCTIPDPAASIAEMMRVLRPGGLLLHLGHIGSSLWPIWAAQRLVEPHDPNGWRVHDPPPATRWSRHKGSTWSRPSG